MVETVPMVRKKLDIYRPVEYIIQVWIMKILLQTGQEENGSLIIRSVPFKCACNTIAG